MSVFVRLVDEVYKYAIRHNKNTSTPPFKDFVLTSMFGKTEKPFVRLIQNSEYMLFNKRHCVVVFDVMVTDWISQPKRAKPTSNR